MKCNQSRPGFEHVSPCPFPTTITITCGWRYAWKRWSWEFEKEAVGSWDWTIELRQFSSCHWGESWILTVKKCSWDFRISTDRIFKHHKMRRAFVGSDSIVSRVRIVSHPSCRRTEVKKLIKPFVPETIESACIWICVLHLYRYSICIAVCINTWNYLTISTYVCKSYLSNIYQ